MKDISIEYGLDSCGNEKSINIFKAGHPHWWSDKYPKRWDVCDNPIACSKYKHHIVSSSLARIWSTEVLKSSPNPEAPALQVG